MQNLTFHGDYVRKPEGISELGRLILDVFAVDISSLHRLGHDPSVMSFGWWHGETLIANVSLFERRLWLAGECVTAFGVQSVATRPEWRGKGLFRDLMLRALDYADARSGLVTLHTGTPDLYRPFGFRQLEETKFFGNWEASPQPPRYRELSLNLDADVELLRDLFSRRSPTSRLASACDHPALFMLKAALTPAIKLLHLPDLDAVVATRGDEHSLILLDIIAPVIPPLEAIASAIGFQGSRIEVRFTPDHLAWQPDESLVVDNGNMVRGSFAAEGKPFMLSTMHA